MSGLDKYWSAQAIAEAIEAGGIVVAESGTNIIEVAHVEPIGNDLVLWKIYVTPSAQKQAVGHRLMDAAKDRARLHGGDLITEFDARNEQVREFYLREGFQATAALWPNTDALVIAVGQRGHGAPVKKVVHLRFGHHR